MLLDYYLVHISVRRPAFLVVLTVFLGCLLPRQAILIQCIMTNAYYVNYLINLSLNRNQHLMQLIVLQIKDLFVLKCYFY